MRRSLDPDRLFAELSEFEHLAVAVSGGSDSMALLTFVSDWSLRVGVGVTALTVDHGLRPGSRREADYVAECCRHLGIAHHTLYWDGEKPASGLSDAARGARYRLLARFCAEHAITALLTGHTRDDQAETIYMRLKRSALSNRGLAGMAFETRYRSDPLSEITIYRPLLCHARSALRAMLVGKGVGWIDDPTNDNTAYERVRARSLLAQSPDFAEDLIQYGRCAGRLRRLHACQAADFIETHVRVGIGDQLFLPRAALRALAEPVAVLTVQALMSVVGGREHLPPARKVMAVLRESGRATLSRVIVTQDDTTVSLRRENRNLAGEITLSSAPQLWDGRYFLWLNVCDGRVPTVRCLRSHETADAVVSSAMPLEGHNVKQVLATQPMVFDASGDFHDPSGSFHSGTTVGSVSCRHARGAFERFCPAFDLPLLDAIDGLFTRKLHPDTVKHVTKDAVWEDSNV
ncbi:MAG: tRNA lysidine(34) synthetase TilS [Pseudomonadota bacterium]